MHVNTQLCLLMFRSDLNSSQQEFKLYGSDLEQGVKDDKSIKVNIGVNLSFRKACRLCGNFSLASSKNKQNKQKCS